MEHHPNINNPAEIAAPIAENQALLGDRFASDPISYATLTNLENWAAECNFTDQEYFVDTSRGFVIPASYDNSPGQKVRYNDLKQLSFEGTFRGYSKIVIGKIIGAGSVRAYCLTFEDVTLLPFFDTMPEEDILHVPALAVNTMEQTS